MSATLERRPPRRTAGDRAFGVVAHVVLTVWALLVILPLIWTVYSSFKGSREILTSLFALPFTVFFLYAFFRQLPEEIAGAAAIDGAGDFRTFFQVMIPMAGPGLASVTIFNFLGLCNQFLLPVVLNTDEDKYVLAQGLVNLQAQQGYLSDWGAMFASVTITILPVLIVYVIFQRQLQGGIGPSTNK